VKCRPTGRTKRVVMASLLVLVVIWTALCVLVVYGCTRGLCGSWWAITIIVCCLVGVVGLFVLLVRQPRSDVKLHFQTPLVPWIPLASVLVNIFLMVAMSPATWIRFAVWMAIGKDLMLFLPRSTLTHPWPIQHYFEVTLGHSTAVSDCPPSY